MRVVAIIPARYKSSRFEGKPLAEINGKPMIWWVYNQAIKVKEIDSVYVATEDDRIVNVCKKYGMNVMLTSDSHQTGTDRIGEVAKKIHADLYLNIQGDEPLIEPEVIRQAIVPFLSDNSLLVTNLMTRINDPIEVVNNTVPKVIVNKDYEGIFLTRSVSPYPKGSLNFSYYKQVCVYGFKPEALDFFCSNPRGSIEQIEDIEILRFIESRIKVKYVEVESKTIAVDTPKDLNKVIEYLKNGKAI